MTSEAQHPPGAGRTLERALLVLLCLAIGGFHVWTVRSSGDPWKFGAEQRDYYNLLIDGYLDGQLHMKVDVPDALLRLKDPYDPAQRPPGVGLHDASFYQGRYYVYFGAAPMIVLMLPFRLLTGIDLPLAVATLIFIHGGFLASTAIFLAVRRRYFPAAGLPAVLLGVAALGLGGVGPVLLRRPHMWELPIGGGYGFATLCLACLWRALHAERNRARWLAAAGGCVGLAVASRPTYLVVLPLLGAPLLWWWLEARRAGRGGWPWREAMAAAAPLVVIGGLMAWHNAARFGSPLQFGQAYQFSLDYESRLPHFGAAYVPYNLRNHFWEAADWSRYFPFIRPGDAGPAPPGFTIHRGDVYGILFAFPVVWLALFTPLALWRRSFAERGPLAAWLGAVAVLFAGAAGLLLSFFSALARYQMDFLPALLLLGVVGWLALERWLALAGRRTGRFVLSSLAGAAAAYTAVFGVLFSLQFDRLLGERNPRLERAVARTLNYVPAALERLGGGGHGPVELLLRLPAARPPGRETLFTSGMAPRLDRAFIQYRDDGRVQFGLASPESQERMTRPLALDPGAPHRIVIGFGSLYPPDTHPFFAGRGADEVARMAREAYLEVDGETVWSGRQRPRGVAAGGVRFGQDARVAPGFPPFRGETISVRRLGHVAGPGARPPDTFVRLRLAFNPRADWTVEPLVTFGAGAAATLLAVHRNDETHVRFALGGRTGESARSDVLAFGPGRAHEVVVTSAGGGPAGGRRFHVFVDGVLWWARDRPGAPGAGPEVTVGQNSAAFEGCAPAFGGQLHSAQVGEGGRDPLIGPGETLRLRLRFPPGVSGGREPLVVTGRTGAGDLLLVEYVEAESVRFALDHWGSPLQLSPPVRLDRAQPHEVEVTMTSLATTADATLAPNVRAGRVRVQVDGGFVWEQAAEFAPAEPEEVTVGRNPIDGTTCAPAFSGDVLRAERIVRE